MAMQVRTRPAPTPDDLVDLARRHFIRGERLDVAGLGEELGISRATAYRWAGNEEALTGRVIASLAEATFRRCVKEARGKGFERVLDAERRGLRYMASFKPYRAFLDREDAVTSMRIVASKDGPVQPLQIRQHEEWLQELVDVGEIRLAVDAHTMAYALVRTAEAFLYADLIAGEDMDIDKAIAVMRLLLR
ncbi:MAG: QsdR family transcriptional regulator [Actinomycetota bacterium]